MKPMSWTDEELRAKGVQLDSPEYGNFEERLMNLLAVVHRDGGHYVVTHGLARACEEAERVVQRLHAYDDRLEPGR